MTTTATPARTATTATTAAPEPGRRRAQEAARTRDTCPAGASEGRKTGGPRVEVRDDQGWFTVCGLDDLVPGRGVAALLRDGSQAAVFVDRAGRAYVIGNRDPFTGAYVLSRGLLGSTADDPAGPSGPEAPEAPETSDGTEGGGRTGGAGRTPFVASPLLKQRFDLRTGRCLDDGTVSVPVFRSRIR